jgi:hypothetical protein
VRFEVNTRWRREQFFCLSIGFHCWAMLSRAGRHPRLRSALLKASRAQEELQLSQVSWNQRFIDAEAAWHCQIALEQAAKEAALQRVEAIEVDLKQSKAAYDNTFGLLQQVEADKEFLTKQIRKRESEETERLNQHLHDVHRRLDEHAGQHEASLHLLMAKEQENERLRKEVESLSFQVRSFCNISFGYTYGYLMLKVRWPLLLFLICIHLCSCSTCEMSVAAR